MKHKKKVTLFLLMLLCITAEAQQATIATGGEATGEGGTSNYSVGQIVYTKNMDGSGSVSQGVQQPYEIFTLGIKVTELHIKLSLFPNPTNDNLTIQIRDYNNEDLRYQLLDMQGKLLIDRKIFSKKTQINISTLANAIYLLHIVNKENKKAKSFKIIKN
jgi:hypothetical protein